MLYNNRLLMLDSRCVGTVNRPWGAEHLVTIASLTDMAKIAPRHHGPEDLLQENGRRLPF